MHLRYFNFLLSFLTLGLDNGYCAQSTHCQTNKKAARFAESPNKNHPLKIVVLRGLGRDPVKVEQSFNEKFKHLKRSKNIKISVVDYKKVNLEGFEKEILKIWQALHEDKNDDEKLKLLQEKEK